MHIRRRSERAERIRGLLSDMLGGDAQFAETLRTGAYGATTVAAEGFGVSLMTASRDLALCRRMLAEFRREAGRDFDAEIDEVVWSWDFARYGFRTRHSLNPSRCVRRGEARYPFSTR